jgi:hypothetical protein
VTDIAMQDSREIARPLNVLVPLIREDLKAAEAAGLPYYRAAGEKMIEAKGQLEHGRFEPWIKRNFGIGIRQAQQYMKFYRTTTDMEKRIETRFSTFSEAVRETTNNPNFGKPAPWRADIAEKVKQALEQAERWQDEALSRKQEREAERKLALQLIDIGFKALASKLHPDKGGSRDAMARLNRVRSRLKQSA